jgi:hypothetical protein
MGERGRLGASLTVGYEFERAVLRELDQIRETFERACARLEERDEARDSEVSELKLSVGLLRGECKRNLKRDAGLVSVPTIVVAAATALLQYLAPPATPAPAPPRAPVQAPPTGG